MADVEAGLSAVHAMQSALATVMMFNLTAWRYPAPCTVSNNSKYDFIVIGSGTGGSVIASRLSENSSVNVLLVEAGGYSPIEADDFPGLFPILPRSAYDYDYLAQNDHYSAQNLQGHAISATAGKMLGGSSSLKHSLYVRGYPQDYDEWAELLGDDSWNYNNSLKYFKKIENIRNEDLRESPFYSKHFGTNGMIKLTRESNPTNNKYLDAFREIGHNIENVTVNLGFAETLFDIGDGLRQSTSLKYLGAAKYRPNLCLSLFTVATKIIIKNSVAIGVQMTMSNGETYVVYAKYEVIVCAGVFNSPKLLMLSGIGPKAHLDEMGIEVIADLSVGQNLRDHPPATVVYAMEKSEAPLVAANPHAFSVPIFVGAAALDPSESVPFYMTFNLEIQHDSPALVQLCSVVFKYSKIICQKFCDANKGRTLLFVVNNLLAPKSTGQVILASSDPSDDPIICPGTFSNKSDLVSLARSLEDYHKVVNTTYFRSVNAEMVDLGLCSDCDGSDFWECYSRKMSATMWHYCSTCAMGTVLDSRLRVKGVKSLRVVDASAMPLLVRGKTHAAVNMLAEHGADIIMTEWNMKV